MDATHMIAAAPSQEWIIALQMTDPSSRSLTLKFSEHQHAVKAFQVVLSNCQVHFRGVPSYQEAVAASWRISHPQFLLSLSFVMSLDGDNLFLLNQFFNLHGTQALVLDLSEAQRGDHDGGDGCGDEDEDDDDDDDDIEVNPQDEEEDELAAAEAEAEYNKQKAEMENDLMDDDEDEDDGQDEDQDDEEDDTDSDDDAGGDAEGDSDEDDDDDEEDDDNEDEDDEEEDDDE